MIITAASACMRSARPHARVFLRALHRIPALKNDASFARNGISGLYSAQGYKSAWTEYQTYLTTSLTIKTAGTKFETRTPLQIVLLTSKNGLEQSVFHYALQAHNNHLFFEQLTERDAAAATVPSRFLLEQLAHQDIQGLQGLKDRLVEASRNVTGQGWVFLVERGDKSVEVLTSNNDGTPYYFGRTLSLDVNGGLCEDTYRQYETIKLRATDHELDFTLPLVAISLWDVSYMADYGMNGRLEYLQNVVDCISWDVVNLRRFQI